jgi:hypothetical protein
VFLDAYRDAVAWLVDVQDRAELPGCRGAVALDRLAVSLALEGLSGEARPTPHDGRADRAPIATHGRGDRHTL